MTIVSAIVLYAVLWFIVMFVLLPIRLETQGDRGEIVPGTHAGAPANFNAGRKAKMVTLVAAAVWLVIVGIVWTGWIGIEDLDHFGRPGDDTVLRPPAD